jgi:hypothetical protein
MYLCQPQVQAACMRSRHRGGLQQLQQQLQRPLLRQQRQQQAVASSWHSQSSR